MTNRKQESRTMMVGARVTPSEKLAIEWVAGMKRTDVSNLLREMSVESILREHTRLTEMVA